jgi:FtsH-binding integral membrane protein
MDNRFLPSSVSSADGVAFDAGLRAHMQRIFATMGGGLAVTGLVAYIVAHTALITIVMSPLRWLIVLAPLGIAMFMNFRLHTAKISTLQAMFWAFCVLMGMSMASLFVIYTGDSIARTFFITAATFGTMSLWGYTTKRDLTGMGSFMMMGIIGLIIAGLVNLFLMSPMLYWVTSVAGVLIFTGLTAFDAQRIKQNYAESWGADTNERLAIMGSLQLYLDFINMFVYLLQLTGAVRRD